MRQRDRRWVVTIWQPIDRGQSTPRDFVMNAHEFSMFGDISAVIGLRDGPWCERAVVANGHLVTVREKREEE